MKNTIIFNTEQEVIDYFGGLDKIPSNVLAMVKEIPYTSSGVGKIENALFSSTNNANAPEQGTALRPAGTSAVTTVKNQAAVAEDLDELSSLTYAIRYGEENTNTNISE